MPRRYHTSVSSASSWHSSSRMALASSYCESSTRRRAVMVRKSYEGAAPSSRREHTSTVRRTSSSASPRRFCESRRSASAWHASALSGSCTSDWSSSSSHRTTAPSSRKQSVKYTFASAAITADVRFVSSRSRARVSVPSALPTALPTARPRPRPSPLLCLSAPAPPSPPSPPPRPSPPPPPSPSSAAWRTRRRSTRSSASALSNAATALAPCSRCPSSTYLACPSSGASSTDLASSSCAPSVSPISASSSAAASIAAWFPGSASSTLPYSRSADSTSPLSASCRARRTSAEGGGAAPTPTPFIHSAISQFRSGSCPNDSINDSHHRTTACRRAASPSATRAASPLGALEALACLSRPMTRPRRRCQRPRPPPSSLCSPKPVAVAAPAH
mmetsp:Transcript_28530/g.93225  ORF Transcript_28530/g.93225 Transcript_28530/m.93225 type:complete len:389 (-) Transcript_28530:155-1321(-)